MDLAYKVYRVVNEELLKLKKLMNNIQSGIGDLYTENTEGI